MLKDIMTDIRVFFDKIGRFFYWGWKLRESYEWDAHFVYEMIYLKLDDNYKCFKNHGHLVWNESEHTNRMKKLREAKELAKKLFEDDYQLKSIEAVEAKYGPIQLNFTKYGSFSSAKIDYPVKSRAYRHYTDIMDRKFDTMRETDKKRLYYLLNKYLRYWWD
jgi:hypothetical protein